MKVYIGPYPGVRSKAKRKINVRIDKYDDWSLDHTLALIIAPALKAFKKSKHIGTPASFCSSWAVPYTEPANKEEVKARRDKEKEEHQAWLSTIDKMIWSFNEIANDCPGEDKLFKKHYRRKKGGDILGRYECNDRDAYRADMQEYQSRIQEGLDLFAKHYQSLWT